MKVNYAFHSALFFILCSCDSNINQGPKKISISPPDIGLVGSFLSCKAKPMRALTSEEKCRIKKLSARCLPADDCLVSCIVSRDGNNVGGGCEHVCFSALHDPVTPLIGLDDCLEKPVSGSSEK